MKNLLYNKGLFKKVYFGNVSNLLFLPLKINNEDCGDKNQDSAASKFGISSTTRAVDIIPILCRKYVKNQHPKHYRLKPPNQGL